MRSSCCCCHSLYLCLSVCVLFFFSPLPFALPRQKQPCSSQTHTRQIPKRSMYVILKYLVIFAIDKTVQLSTLQKDTDSHTHITCLYLFFPNFHQLFSHFAQWSHRLYQSKTKNLHILLQIHLTRSEFGSWISTMSKKLDPYCGNHMQISI